jgi:hypothetical protein
MAGTEKTAMIIPRTDLWRNDWSEGNSIRRVVRARRRSRKRDSVDGGGEGEGVGEDSPLPEGALAIPDGSMTEMEGIAGV